MPTKSNEIKTVNTLKFINLFTVLLYYLFYDCCERCPSINNLVDYSIPKRLGEFLVGLVDKELNKLTDI